MKPALVSLRSFVDDKGVESASLILEVGVATIYRYLKEGSYFVEYLGASEQGDDAAMNLWHCKKMVC